jgi:DNA invertase Pin-like site-specific DNA recombinase
MSSPPPVRVAQYVRMSTDHQRYSTENQADASLAYATLRGMVIVRTYEDAGISGLKIKNRLGLQLLLADVESGKVDFEAVLVYDVSRWGRFRNADEAAAYEFRCTQSGVRVIYVAESFTNDGSMQASVFKAVMRVMSYSYSKDLSDKVHAGHCKLLALGYHQGGSPGFGLRRQCVSPTRAVKGVLAKGERKGLQDDNVVLIPGPADEVELVLQVFRWFAQERVIERDIAGRLNEGGQRNAAGREWTHHSIRAMLTCERYVGMNVYNRRSFRLKEQRVKNEPTAWLRSATGAEPIVPRDLWEQAQALYLERSIVLDDDALLSMLKSLYEREGTLSGMLIDEHSEMPPCSVYKKRFGCLRRAYTLIGYHCITDLRYIDENKALRAKHPEFVQTVLAGLASVNADTRLDVATGLITVNEQWTVTVTLARCMTAERADRWHLRFDESLAPDFTVCVRMARNSTEPLDYYVFSRLHLTFVKRSMHTRNPVAIDAFRLDDLGAFYEMAARSPLEAAA